MQFTPENCGLVLSGRKTMTRRIVKDDFMRAGELWTEGEGWSTDGWYDKLKAVIQYPVAVKEGHFTKWEVGKTYAVCPGRGKKAVGRIRITEIRRERLQDISPENCLAEGVDPYTAPELCAWKFKAIWDGLYGNDPVKGWESNPDVWVLSFELVREADNG